MQDEEQDNDVAVEAKLKRPFGFEEVKEIKE